MKTGKKTTTAAATLHVVSQDTQEFFPFEEASFHLRIDALKQLKHPCGRFKSPLSLEKRLKINFIENIENLSLLGDKSLLFLHGTPPNWQTILNYLYENEIVDTPRFFLKKFRNDEPRFKQVRLSPHDSINKTDGRTVDSYGYGMAYSLEEAMSKAIGEVLERFYLTQYRRDDFITLSRAQLLQKKKAFADLRSLNGFLSWQKEAFSNLSWDDSSIFCWAEGRELIQNEFAYIPAQLVFWNYRFEHDEPLLVGPTTSGSAGHFTRNEAILASLLENIERDGFLIYWLNSLSPNVIDVSLIEDEEIKELLMNFERYRLEVYFLNTTTDIGVPSCVCVVVDTAREVILSLGGASGFDLKELLLRSSSEALSIHAFVNKNERHVLPNSYVPFTDGGIGRDERLFVWKGKEMYERFKFFIAGKKQDPKSFMQNMNRYHTPDERLEFMYKRFKEMGEEYKVYCYEVKNNVLETLGYHVVRTIVPPLVPLYLNEKYPTLDAKRLREVPAKLGYASTGNMNPWPHPFP